VHAVRLNWLQSVELLPFLPQLGWEQHINLTGDDHWRGGVKLTAGKFTALQPVLAI